MVVPIFECPCLAKLKANYLYHSYQFLVWGRILLVLEALEVWEPRVCRRPGRSWKARLSLPYTCLLCALSPNRQREV